MMAMKKKPVNLKRIKDKLLFAVYAAADECINGTIYSVDDIQYFLDGLEEAKEICLKIQNAKGLCAILNAVTGYLMDDIIEDILKNEK